MPKPSKGQRRTINEANAVICQRNLYVQTPNGNRRVIHARMSYAGPVVEDLYGGTAYDLLQNKFADGYGQPVVFA